MEGDEEMSQEDYGLGPYGGHSIARGLWIRHKKSIIGLTAGLIVIGGMAFGIQKVQDYYDRQSKNQNTPQQTQPSEGLKGLIDHDNKQFERDRLRDLLKNSPEPQRKDYYRDTLPSQPIEPAPLPERQIDDKMPLMAFNISNSHDSRKLSPSL